MTPTARWIEVCRETYNRGSHVQSVTTRLKVPSGWVYRTVQYQHDEYYAVGAVASTALTFVPHKSATDQPQQGRAR